VGSSIIIVNYLISPPSVGYIRLTYRTGSSTTRQDKPKVREGGLKGGVEGGRLCINALTDGQSLEELRRVVIITTYKDNVSAHLSVSLRSKTRFHSLSAASLM